MTIVLGYSCNIHTNSFSLPHICPVSWILKIIIPILKRSRRGDSFYLSILLVFLRTEKDLRELLKDRQMGKLRLREAK